MYFPLVNFLIYSVNKRRVLIAKPHLYVFPDFTSFTFLPVNPLTGVETNDDWVAWLTVILI